MPLTDFHLIHINNINGDTSFSLESLNADISLQGLLIQTVIKRILTVPGSDAAYPQIGSNIGQLFGTMTLEEADQMKVLFPIFLKTIEDEIIEEQELLGLELLPEEKLRRLKLQSVEFDQSFLG
jgi:hypothetical protein